LRGVVKDSVLAFFREAKPGRLLDIPSGTCWLARGLEDLPGWEYFGVDLFADPKSENFRRADLNDDIPFEEGQFDYVACLEGLEHIENLHHALREFHRVLKPGGTLVVSTPNPLCIASRKRYLMTGTYYGFPHLVHMPKEGEHVHINPINLSSLISFAGKYGFDLGLIHPLKPNAKMYRFIIAVMRIKVYTWLKYISRDRETKVFMERLSSVNVLLNNEMLVSFKKRQEESRL